MVDKTVFDDVFDALDEADFLCKTTHQNHSVTAQGKRFAVMTTKDAIKSAADILESVYDTGQ
jgi:hypothetical protein